MAIILANALVFAALGFVAGYVKGRGVGRREILTAVMKRQVDLDGLLGTYKELT